MRGLKCWLKGHDDYIISSIPLRSPEHYPRLDDYQCIRCRRKRLNVFYGGL